MTVQYEGRGLYNLMIGNRSVILEQSEIDDIKNFDFDTMKIDEGNEFYKDKIERLEENLEDLVWEIGVLADKINDGEIEGEYKIAEELRKIIK